MRYILIDSMMRPLGPSNEFDDIDAARERRKFFETLKRVVDINLPYVAEVITPHGKRQTFAEEATFNADIWDTREEKIIV